MSTFTIGQTEFLVLNTDMLGLNADQREQSYEVHPLIRTNWRCLDHLQDSYNYVPTTYLASDGTLVGAERVGLTMAANLRPWLAADHTVLNAGHPGATTMKGSILSDPLYGAGLASQTNVFEVMIDAAGWNSFCTEPYMNAEVAGRMTNLLGEEGKATLFSGIPYFVRYFGDATHMTSPGLVPGEGRFYPATQTVTPLISDSTFNIEPGIVRMYYNHKFKYTLIDYSVPENGGNIEINPTYNYYLNTSPSYEPAVNELNLPPSILPNYYVLEACYKYAVLNDGSLPYAGETTYINTTTPDADTLMGALVQVIDIFSGTSPEDSAAPTLTSAGYYQYYLNALESQAGSTLQNTIQQYEQNYRNIAVLSPEIGNGFLDSYNHMVRNVGGAQGYGAGTAQTSDDLLAIKTYPFYNELVIPYENQYQDPDDVIGGDYFEDMLDYPGVEANAQEQFITLLQLFIMTRYQNPEFGSTHRWGFQPPDPGETSPTMQMTRWQLEENGGESPVIDENMSMDVLIYLEDFIGSLNNMANSGGMSEWLTNLTQWYNHGAAAANYAAGIILRDGFAADVDPNSPANAIYFNLANINSLLTTLGAAANGIVDKFTRFKDIFKNTPGTYRDSEAIMYIVEKREVPAGQASVASDDPSTVVQTLFFGRDVRALGAGASRRGVHYYDTQIKYGVRYQYDMKQVRLVFGNKYKYQPGTTVSVVNSLQTGQGRALGNALGLFAPENHWLTTTPSYIKTDTPGLYSYTPSVATTIGTFHPSLTQGFPYVAEGDEVPTVPGGQNLAGTYIYRWSDSMSNETAALRGVWDISTAGAVSNVDLSKIMLKTVVGDGFDGYGSGGFIVGTPPDQSVGEEASEMESLPEADLSFEPTIQDLGGEEDQGGSQALADALAEIEMTLGADIAQEVEDWVSEGGPIQDILDVVFQAGAGGVDPSMQRGGFSGITDKTANIDIVRNMQAGLENLGIDAGTGGQQAAGFVEIGGIAGMMDFLGDFEFNR